VELRDLAHGSEALLRVDVLVEHVLVERDSNLLIIPIGRRSLVLVMAVRKVLCPLKYFWSEGASKLIWLEL
jgi:hypothetical protein